MKMKKEVAIQRPVDEAAGSSNVFSMAQWQTQMTSQVQIVAELYHVEVSFKREADQRYQLLSDQMEEKIIKLVETQSLNSQLQIALQAEMAETESWRR